MSQANSGIIKRILKDHFDGYWKMHSDLFPESYREDIKETVEKAIRCVTRGMPAMNVLVVKVDQDLFLFVLLVKVVFAISVVRNIQMIGQISNRK